ncbi:MAG: rhomboid family GlyGly-CTERM serine protease [Flavobacteriales bacterium]|jgi:rhomboid family GlyGly-CTERM serine protease
MFNLPVEKKYSLAPLLIVIISIILALIEPLSSDILTYDRSQLNNFQWWRLITGHFLHTNNMHLLLNTLGLTLLWALHGHYYQTLQYLIQFFLLCLGTSIGLYLFDEQMQWYVGLSGVLHGLFVIGTYFDILKKFKTGWLMLICIWLKVIHEQVYGASQDIAHLIAANVAIDAHLFGTVTGCIIIVYYFVSNKIKSRIKIVTKKR